MVQRPTTNDERLPTILAFFFELFFFRRAETRRWTQRFPVIEQGQIAHVQRKRAGWRFLVNDDGDGTAFDALSERDAAAAGKPGVREPLQHCPRSYYRAGPKTRATKET